MCYFEALNDNNMTTFTNTTGTKKVNISKDSAGNIRAMLVQVYKNEEQVLESKSFATVKNAEKWSKKVLN